MTRVCRKRILAQLLFPHLKTDFCDTIETKAVVVISLDSRANSRQKSKKHELRFVRSHLCSNNPPLYIKSSLENRCSKRCLFSIRPRQMIGKSRVVVGRIEGILECLFFCLLSGGKSRFTDSCCSTRCKQNSLTGGKKPSKPDRGCKFRASIEHKLTRGLSQKTVCVYAICSPLSRLSSQFCYNVTKCSWMQENKSVNVFSFTFVIVLFYLMFTSCCSCTNDYKTPSSFLLHSASFDVLYCF